MNVSFTSLHIPLWLQARKKLFCIAQPWQNITLHWSPFFILNFLASFPLNQSRGHTFFAFKPHYWNELFFSNAATDTMPNPLQSNHDANARSYRCLHLAINESAWTQASSCGVQFARSMPKRVPYPWKVSNQLYTLCSS